MTYPFLPAVEPFCSAPAQLPRRAQSSPPAGGFYSQNPAQDRDQTGGLSGAVKAAKPTAMAEKSSPELCRRSSYTPSAPLAGRADAAPGGSHPQQAGRGTRTQETEMTKEREMIRRLAMVLDASIPALDAAARLEKRREEGKSMRQITEQERAKIARKLVARAEAFLVADDEDDDDEA